MKRIPQFRVWTACFGWVMLGVSSPLGVLAQSTPQNPRTPPAANDLAKGLYVARDRGAKPVLVRLLGRTLTPAERAKIGPPYTDVQVNARSLRLLEAAVRGSGLTKMESGMGAQTISVKLDGSWKTVRSNGSARFRKAWRAIHKASISKGSSRRDVAQQGARPLPDLFPPRPKPIRS